MAFPKLRTVNKAVPPYQINEFPSDFPNKVGKRLIYIIATRGKTDIEGKEWEQIFASSVGAEWKPSNVGLDDIVLGNTAWGAKSVKSPKPSKQKNVRLISGRNDLGFSYDIVVTPGNDANIIGEKVLEIYNERVSSVREKFKHVRTIVLIRSEDLSEVVIYESETIMYDPEKYRWEWHKKNLWGYDKKTNEKKFTWQSGGTQFTIAETVPTNHLLIIVKKADLIKPEVVLDEIGFDESWISVTRNRG